MPRTARKKSETKIYHVMLRGINLQQLFKCDADNEKFLVILEDYKKICGFELYGYCLMGNHVHLLIKTVEEDLAMVFKRIGVKYAAWHNWKYDRLGHLFQDRFRSEPVEDEEYFLTVLRYIHLNPIKSGICGKLDEYPWSSYSEYVGDCRLVDTVFALEMTGLAGFVEFHNMEISEDAEKTLEKYARARLTDREVKKLMWEVCKCDSADTFLKFDAQERKSIIRNLKEAGASVRQVSRLTGVGRGIVGRT